MPTGISEHLERLKAELQSQNDAFSGVTELLEHINPRAQLNVQPAWLEALEQVTDAALTAPTARRASPAAWGLRG